jgi:hypothetical protein
MMPGKRFGIGSVSVGLVNHPLTMTTAPFLTRKEFAHNSVHGSAAADIAAKTIISGAKTSAD